MTDGPNQPPTTSYDPATMVASSLGTIKTVWYRRPWFLITMALVLIVAISVITDLPHRITNTEDVADQNASLKQINGDIAPCTFAVHEAFTFYNEFVSAKFTKSNIAQIPKLLVGDQTACSFASGSIYDLTNNIQIVRTKAGKHLDTMMPVIVEWTTDGALAAIEDIQTLFTTPDDAKAIRNLGYNERKLTRDRTTALNDVSDASAILGVTLAALKLPVLPHLKGT